jgi:hypothetical protein
MASPAGLQCVAAQPVEALPKGHATSGNSAGTMQSLQLANSTSGDYYIAETPGDPAASAHGSETSGYQARPVVPLPCQQMCLYDF